MIEASGKVRVSRNKWTEHFMSMKSTKNGVEILTEESTYAIIFYRSNVVRIHRFGEVKNTNPYAVISGPEETSLSVEENEESVVIVGPDFDIIVDKQPLLFTFLTKDGKKINADERGLGTSAQGEQVTVYKELQENERFIGLGEKTGPLDRRGSGYQNWNTDHFAYGVDADPIYASIPFYIGAHNEMSYGIFVDNSHKSHFNFGASNNRFSSFSVDSGDMDYYFFSGSVADIISSYTWLTGRMKLPPAWSIGYQQCRYSYYPDTEVLEVAEKFRSKNIPADVIVLDIHHMEGFKIFSWDQKNFPTPEKMIAQLKELGFEVVVICDPGIKIEEGYKPYTSGLEEDIFIKYPDGQLYEGEVWPGWCHFPDFTKEGARKWWAKMMQSYTKTGVRGFWNDMNEIATWGQMLPENIEFEMEGDGATTRKARNIYGLQMTKASYEGAKENLDGQRPFILTRAGFSGVQRYSAMWTGDNVANDDHMMLGVRLVNSLGLSGIAFSGYDVGGFAGNGQSRLFARWIQLGAFSPFFRGHSMINSHDSEPWAYGEEVEEISANYIRLRYKLLPYIYSRFLHASETGIPVCKSLAIDHTHDEKVYLQEFENQYYFGPSLLVSPLRSDEQFAKTYLPEGDWYDFFTDERFEGGREVIREYKLEKLPLFVKSSSIIPLFRDAGKNTADSGETLEVHLYQGEAENTFDYYEDDGVSYQFEENKFHRRTISHDPIGKQVRLDALQGEYMSRMKRLRVVLHGLHEAPGSSDWKEESYSFLTPISAFDPLTKEEDRSCEIDKVFVLEQDYKNETMIFSW